MKKFCGKCGVAKELLEFPRDARREDGHFCYCKICHCKNQKARRAANPAKVVAQNAQSLQKRHLHKATDPEGFRNTWWVRYLRREYNLSPQQYSEMWTQQKGLCAICEVTLTKLNAHVDHKHHTDPVIVRGILCHNCNTSLGKFLDSPAVLKKALNYLEKYE